MKVLEWITQISRIFETSLLIHLKKNLFLLLLSFSFSIYCSAQVLCIKCYNQNARILTDTNNLIVNGGFENTTCIPSYATHSFCPNSSIYDCSIANWICTGGGSSTYACIFDSSNLNGSRSIVIEGKKAVYFGNYFCNACSSTQSDTSCIINMGCQVTGIPTGYPYNTVDYGGTTGVNLQQTVNGLMIGAIYLLEFWAGGERDIDFNKNGLFAVDVGFGNILLRDPPTPRITGIGIRYIIVFEATSSFHIIKFTSWGHISFDFAPTCTELVLDDVRLFAANPDGGNPCITSINDLSQNTMTTVFPNPATNSFSVTTNTNQPSEIILFDIASRKLMQQKFTGSVSLNIENLAKGIYFYQIRDENGAVSQGKVVKE